jgi:hypothetical protein
LTQIFCSVYALDYLVALPEVELGSSSRSGSQSICHSPAGLQAQVKCTRCSPARPHWGLASDEAAAGLVVFKFPSVSARQGSSITRRGRQSAAAAAGLVWTLILGMTLHVEIEDLYL